MTGTMSTSWFLRKAVQQATTWTVSPKAERERWSSIAIKDIVGTPDMPNPKDDSQEDTRSERNTRGLDCGASGGQFLPKQGETRAGLEQELQNQQSHLGEVRPGDANGEGCENNMTGDDAKPRSCECRVRLEELMPMWKPKS